VDNKLENIVISPKRCHILAHFEHLAYDNKKPVNNIVICKKKMIINQYHKPIGR
jgi:hypothetical protein